MKIVYEHNGITCIAHIPNRERVELSNPEINGMTDAEFLTWIRDLTIPANAKNLSVVDDNMIPADREFRNALKPDLTFDKPTCVEITKERLRRERAPKLQELDVAQLNAENNAEIARIKAEKQKLRDVTKAATLELNLEQLKALHA